MSHKNEQIRDKILSKAKHFRNSFKNFDAQKESKQKSSDVSKSNLKSQKKIANLSKSFEINDSLLEMSVFVFDAFADFSLSFFPSVRSTRSLWGR